MTGMSGKGGKKDEESDPKIDFIRSGVLHADHARLRGRACRSHGAGWCALPSDVNGYTVTRVDFTNCSKLTEAAIPDGVTSFCFDGCSALKSVTIPEGVRSIEERAFADCTALTEISLPSSVTMLQDDAFAGCHTLTVIELPESLSSIGSGAFQDCKNLQTIKIPKSVTDISASAFSGCSKLTVTIPKTVTHIGGYDYKTASFAPFYKVKAAKYTGSSTKTIKSAISPYAKKTTKHSITLKWTEFTKASSYKIYQYNHRTKTWKLLKTIRDPKTTTYQVKHLKSGKRYTFKVKVVVNGKTYENTLRLQRTKY